MIISNDYDLSKSELKIMRYMWNPILKMNVPYITPETLKSKGKIDSATVDYCLTQLTSLDYIKLDEYSKTYNLTVSGRLVLEKRNSNFKSKILWSFVIPFLTALITSIVTVFISN